MRERRDSTQWSMARTPVESQIHSGVRRERVGSRSTAEGAIEGWKNFVFEPERGSTAPAIEVYSPALRVVGIQIRGTVAGLREEVEDD